MAAAIEFSFLRLHGRAISLLLPYMHLPVSTSPPLSPSRSPASCTFIHISQTEKVECLDHYECIELHCFGDCAIATLAMSSWIGDFDGPRRPDY